MVQDCCTFYRAVLVLCYCMKLLNRYCDQQDLRGVVSTEAIQSATAATNSTAMRLVPEIEALLSSNAPADALSLQDLALLLESFELKRAMQKKQVAAPVVHHKAPQSSSDKKRLSIGKALMHSHRHILTLTPT